MAPRSLGRIHNAEQDGRRSEGDPEHQRDPAGRDPYLYVFERLMRRGRRGDVRAGVVMSVSTAAPARRTMSGPGGWCEPPVEQGDHETSAQPPVLCSAHGAARASRPSAAPKMLGTESGLDSRREEHVDPQAVADGTVWYLPRREPCPAAA